jgi:hypothetical protein
MMQEIWAESNKKVKAFFCSSRDLQREKWKNITPKELYAFIGILIALRQNHGKRLHLDKMWTSNVVFAQSFFYSSEGQTGGNLFHIKPVF